MTNDREAGGLEAGDASWQRFLDELRRLSGDGASAIRGTDDRSADAPDPLTWVGVQT